MMCPNCGHEGFHSITDMYDSSKIHFICEPKKETVLKLPLLGYKDGPPGISRTNPLKDIPYWGSNDGNNLNAIHALEWAQSYIELMNRELPCEENVTALCHIRLALAAQRDRYRLRTQQGVLGTNRAHKPAAPLADIA